MFLKLFLIALPFFVEIGMLLCLVHFLSSLPMRPTTHEKSNSLSNVLYFIIC